MMLFYTSILHTFATTNCKPKLFGLEPWYQYLQLDSNCNVKNFTILNPSHPSSFLLIGLAILDDLIRIAALVAAGFVIYGGIQYVTSQGSPDATNKARETIINALIGLVLAIVAASLVSFIGTKLGS
jgi:hypothetical protein